MKIEEVFEARRQALQRLVDSYGSVAEMARQCDLDENRIRHLLNGYRNLGEKAARQMEEDLGLPDFYFDLNVENAISLVQMFLHLDPRDKEEIERLISVLASRHDKNYAGQ